MGRVLKPGPYLSPLLLGEPMETYVALLRGINVGGKNKIVMAQLKEVFIKAGFKDVQTYINSGNIIFAASGQSEAALQEECRKIIYARFKLDIAVALISAQALAEALANAPSWWDNDEEAKHNAIFIIAPAEAAAILKDVGQAKENYEQVAAYGQVIFWSAPLKTFNHTRWSKVASTSAYGSITIRNANTAKKLLSLVKG